MRAACHGGGSDTSVAVSTERAQTESTNPEALFVRLVDARGTLRAVPAMTETTPARPDHSTPSPILTLEDGGVVGGGMLAGTALLAVAHAVAACGIGLGTYAITRKLRARSSGRSHSPA